MKLQNTIILFFSIGLYPIATLADTPPSATPVQVQPVEGEQAAEVVADVATETQPATAQEPELTENEKAYWAKAKILWNSLDRRTGTIALPGNFATLTVPDTFYYLGPDDAEKVLVEVWENPPSAEKPLGMLFPVDMTPYDDNSWAVTIEYSDEGYVSDEDADDIDYDDMLKEMQAGTEETSKERAKQGYESIALIGWAERPSYDKNERKLHWAKELKFGDSENHTLNYNVRVLGRKGVLVMNFIAGMDQLPEIKNNIKPVMAMADFNPGNRYSEFNPDIDKVAAYGLGGLIAGATMVKTGMWATLLLLLKKFFVVIIIVLGFAAKKILPIFKK